MSESNETVVELATGETKEVDGLRVTFSGGVTVNYDGGKPPQGSVILDFAKDGKDERAVWMQGDWGDAHQVLGFSYRVLNPAELKPRTVRVSIRRS